MNLECSESEGISQNIFNDTNDSAYPPPLNSWNNEKTDQHKI